MDADSGEVAHAFRNDVAHRFRFDAAHRFRDDVARVRTPLLADLVCH